MPCQIHRVYHIVWTVTRRFDGVQPLMPLTLFGREIGEERRSHGGNIL